MGFRALLDAADQLDPCLGAQRDDRGVGAPFVGTHIVHVEARGDGGLEAELVLRSAERLDRARPAYLLGERQRKKRQKDALDEFLHGMSFKIILLCKDNLFCWILRTFTR